MLNHCNYADILRKYLLTCQFETANHALIVDHLASYVNIEGQCWPSIPTIQQHTKASRSQVIQALNAAESSGIITRTKGDRSTVYQFTIIKEAPMTTKVIDINTAIRGRTNKIADPQDFEAFWIQYPRKVGKGYARLAWERALKKVSARIIFGALPEFKEQHADTDPRFIPHPTTWLNREGWDDEYEEEKTNATKLKEILQ